MPPTRLPSDLVRDSKIKTEVLGTETKHVFFAPGNSAKERQLRKEEIWVREECLGQGAFGIVHRERCREGERKDKVRAVKEIKKRVAAGEELDYTRELEAIVKFSNPRYSHCFVSSDGWYETESSVFISMEYLELRDLQRYLTQPLHESDAREITAQVLEGLQIMHENDFVHRDLKPGNIMVVAKRPWFVKIADFGISKRRLDDVTSLRTLQRGTFGFAAPEIFGLGSGADTGSYTTAVDMWSLGAVIHKILTGSPPFQGLAEVFKYINGTTEFPLTDLKQRGISENGQDFISSLMAQDPKDRLTSDSAAKHLWMTMHIDTPEPDISTTISASEAHFDQITVTTASGCWTSDHTVTKLPILTVTQTATPLVSNYRPPSIEECPIEPDVEPSSCLPKDSVVLLQEVSPTALGFGHEPLDTSNPSPFSGTVKRNSTSEDIPTFNESQSPLVVASRYFEAGNNRPSAPVISAEEPIIQLVTDMAELRSRYPQVAEAYNALLDTVYDNTGLEARDFLFQTLSSSLLSRAPSKTESQPTRDHETSGEMKATNSPVSGRSGVIHEERLVTCVACLNDELPVSESAKLRCRHRICLLCLKRLFKHSINDLRYEMPPRCCEQNIPPKHVGRLFDEAFKRRWNKVVAENEKTISCPNAACGKEVIYSRRQRGILNCSHCGQEICRDCGRFHFAILCPLKKSEKQLGPTRLTEDLDRSFGDEEALVRTIKQERSSAQKKDRRGAISDPSRSRVKLSISRTPDLSYIIDNNSSEERVLKERTSELKGVPRRPDPEADRLKSRKGRETEQTMEQQILPSAHAPPSRFPEDTVPAARPSSSSRQRTPRAYLGRRIAEHDFRDVTERQSFSRRPTYVFDESSNDESVYRPGLTEEALERHEFVTRRENEASTPPPDVKAQYAGEYGR